MLALAIEDGGVLETATKTIPILLQTVDLTLYPEGGELVAGLPNRVYFEAFTPAKKPADLAGVIVDQSGKEVAQFRSEHEGRGRFAFTPQARGKYALKITQPSGIRTQYPLPDVKPAGVLLQAEKDVYAADDAVQLALGSVPADRPLHLTLAKRETILAAVDVKAVSPGGEFYLAYMNHPSNNTIVIFPPENGLEVLYVAGHFEANLARALGLIFVRLLFLGVLGLAAGAWVSSTKPRAPSSTGRLPHSFCPPNSPEILMPSCASPARPWRLLHPATRYFPSPVTRQDSL